MVGCFYYDKYLPLQHDHESYVTYLALIIFSCVYGRDIKPIYN